MTHEIVRVAIMTACAGTGAPDLAIGEWLAGRVGRNGDADADLIDLGAACLPDRSVASLPADGLPAAVQDLAPWLNAVDGFLVVLPSGAHAAPRELQNAVEWCTAAWIGKPVAVVTYGHAVHDRSAARHVQSILHGAQATLVHAAVNVCGDPAHCAEHRLIDRNASVERMLDELVRGARAMRVGSAS